MCILKYINLVIAGDEVREADTNQADQEAAGVYFLEELFHSLEDDVVLVGVGDGFLGCMGVEVAVADFYGDAAGEFIFLAELEGDFFGHANELGVQELEVDGVLLEGLFC